MIIEELSISKVFLIKNHINYDERGSFLRLFCSNIYSNNGLMNNVVQGNLSINNLANTLRGFHCQKKPHQESKVITCLSGAIYNVVIDLRPNSKTFLNHLCITLNNTYNYSLHIPEGCANAWITLKDNTTLHYYMSEFYKPEFSFGIRWNDSFFQINWPNIPKIISDKDKNYEDFNLNKFLKNNA